MIQELGENLIETLFCDEKGVNSFIEWVVNTRNYHTHYDDDPEKPHATGKRLRLLLESMECCLFVVYLNALEVKSAQLISILEKSKYKLPIDLQST